jgi:hypothetical protein
VQFPARHTPPAASSVRVTINSDTVQTGRVQPTPYTDMNNSKKTTADNDRFFIAFLPYL